MKIEQVLNCSFSSWYPKFKKITWKSLIIPLPQDFVHYLREDGVVLPEESNENNENTNVEQDTDNEIDWNDDHDEINAVNGPQFPELNCKIKAAISKLGGSAFPKLNWSSAKDATWISLNNSMKCTIPNDIYLLLKSSEFILHDLMQPFKDCDDVDEKTTNLQYELVLRSWVDVNPAKEFRCFVKDNELIGISQRDYTNYYGHIEMQEEDIVDDIVSFFYNEICELFPDSQFIIDVYREKKGCVKLIDINPFGCTTDALLFEWHELESEIQAGNNDLPFFRCVKEDTVLQPSPYRYYAIPRDFAHLSTGEDPYKLLDVLQMSANPTLDTSDED